MDRRKFLSAVGVAGLMMTGKGFSKDMKDEIRLITPTDGDVLNPLLDGRTINGEFLTRVIFSAPDGSRISVNGIAAISEAGRFVAEVPLQYGKNLLTAKDESSGLNQQISVYWPRHFLGKYRLSIDDNIWLLKDLTQHAGVYRSLFDNDYLGFLKKLHDSFGTRIHLNVFYETDGFNLSQMTDQYREEWKSNAGWLRLSFHSRGEFPDRPYQHAGYDEVKRDCELVLKEIKRFAGNEVTGSETTIHWGEVTKEGCRALRDCGYDKLVGYFTPGPDPVAYYLSLDQRKHLNERAAWHDTETGITFVRIAQVINLYPLNRVVAELDEQIIKSSRRAEFIELMIHEQYYHQGYFNYQPDFCEKVTAAVKWAVGRGYQPSFLDEALV